MDYPNYKEKKIKSTHKILFIINLLSLSLCFILPWYIYVQGSFMFILMSVYMIKKYSGFKAITGLAVSIMLMLLLFDFSDFNFTWSLDYVLPSFLIALTTLMGIIVLIRKNKWANYYGMHTYFILVSLLMGGLMIFGVIESIVLGIVTLSIFLATLIAIWIRVGKNYHRNLIKFMHL